MKYHEHESRKRESHLTYDCPQCDSQDLIELDEGDKIRDQRGFSRRLLKRQLRVFVLPVFVVNFRRQVNVKAGT